MSTDLVSGDTGGNDNEAIWVHALCHNPASMEERRYKGFSPVTTVKCMQGLFGGAVKESNTFAIA